MLKHVWPFSWFAQRRERALEPAFASPETAVPQALEPSADHQRHWLAEASRVCAAAARGDLEQRILEIDADGDMGELLHSINHLLDMTDAFVREATATLDYAASGRFFRRVLLNGMLGTFRHAADSINAATKMMDEKTRALNEAESRRQMLSGEFQQTLSVVDGLRDASNEIGSVVRTINQISFQTNMLALNSAVEAARVGEAGAGFAVVASEVKRLADRTGQATNEIQQHVTTIKSAATQAVTAIEQIWTTVRNTSEMKAAA